MAHASPFRPRIVGGLDYVSAPSPLIDDLTRSSAGSVGHSSLCGSFDPGHLTLVSAFSNDEDRGGVAGALRLADLDGVTISDFIATLGTFVMAMADDAFGIGYDRNSHVPVEVTLAEYMRIREACEMAEGRCHAAIAQALGSTTISFAYDHSQEGLDLARDVRMLLDAERAGMTLRDLADAVVTPR